VHDDIGLLQTPQRAQRHEIGRTGTGTHKRNVTTRGSIEAAVGQQRFRILSLHMDQPYLTGSIEEFPLAGVQDRQARRAARALLPWLQRYLDLLGNKSEAKFDISQIPRDPASLAYLAAIMAQIPMLEKQHLLSIATAAELLEGERAIYRRETALVRAMLTTEHPANSSSFSPN